MYCIALYHCKHRKRLSSSFLSESLNFILSRISYHKNLQISCCTVWRITDALGLFGTLVPGRPPGNWSTATLSAHRSSLAQSSALTYLQTWTTHSSMLEATDYKMYKKLIVDNATIKRIDILLFCVLTLWLVAIVECVGYTPSNKKLEKPPRISCYTGRWLSSQTGSGLPNFIVN